MRNYVIINGVNSLTIQGLAIKTLPPITKPIQRNLREEIDGRDGDIVTTLGYGAYDKTIEIGLFGTFDIDEVIAYFNQKGTITFSNEADKVYNFQALEQVDYAELLKFRTANVVLHCQPFKYPTEETPLVEEYEYVTGTGTNVTLDNTSEAIFNKIDLLGNTSQNGTPTPSSPIPVNVVSGDNTIDICGKNLLPNNATTQTINGVTFKVNDDKSVTLNGTARAIADFYMYGSSTDTGEYLYIPKGTYSISEPSSGWFYIGREKTLGAVVGNSALLNALSSQDCYFYGFFIRASNGATFSNLTLYPQLEKGSTATTYEPYIGNTYPLYLGDIELCKIGTYQDFIYKDNGSWYLHKEIGEIVFTNQSEWVQETLGGGAIRYRNNSYQGIFLTPPNNDTPAQALSNIGIVSATDTASGTGLGIALHPIGNFYTKQAGYDNIATIGITFYGILQTPTNILIEDTTLIEQLEELKLATSYEGQTNISQTNNDLPFILDLSALKENSDHLVIDNIGNIYSKPTLDLEGTGIIDIYLNDTQMFEVDLSEKNEIVIDTEKMEAYNPTDNTLANRQVTGDYSKFKLDSGENDLRFSGDLTKATITRYERWL